MPTYDTYSLPADCTAPPQRAALDFFALGPPLLAAAWTTPPYLPALRGQLSPPLRGSRFFALLHGDLYPARS